MNAPWILIVFLAALDEGPIPPALDISRIERRIRVEPEYVAPPLHGLLLLDEAGAFRCWAVFDKTAPDAKYYDVLYFDRNGDGDLTEPGERIVGTWDEEAKAAGMGMTLRVGDVPVPGTSTVHKGLLFSTSPKASWQGFWFRIRWAGEVDMSGGYEPVGRDHTQYAQSAAEAPILWPCPGRALSFALWMDDPCELTIGAENHVNVLIGIMGSRSDTLAVVDESFVDLEKNALIVTVLARDASGRELLTQSRIRGHC